MTSHLPHIMTLANSIIGVSVLAMPFCFKQCGIILATVVLLLSCALSRLACHFLMKSAVMSRRRNFELLAFHAFGQMGKFTVELFIIGFLVGTCIAFFVVVGDLGPQIVGKMIDRNPDDIRTSLLVTTGAFIVLPLGLLRNIDSLSSVCTATIGFYLCLILKVIGESTQHIFTGDWYERVYYWRPAGILQCLPIFSMALFCQTQLFEIYEAIPNASLEKMNHVVRGALNICTLVYLCVGFFGYVAFCTQPFTGNILMSFEPSLSSEMIKMGFVFSVAFSFPLVIFPCRASLNSLLFRRVYTHEPSGNYYMPEARFRCLTFTIVCISLITGVLIPNIEFVLGLVGSTIGVMICLIFPAAFFISISSKNTNERLLAQGILFIGLWIMILGTYANLYAMEESTNPKSALTATVGPRDESRGPLLSLAKEDIPAAPNVPVNPEETDRRESSEQGSAKILDKPMDVDVRREPPVPVERVAITEKALPATQKSVENVITLIPKIKGAADAENNHQMRRKQKDMGGRDERREAAARTVGYENAADRRQVLENSNDNGYLVLEKQRADADDQITAKLNERATPTVVSIREVELSVVNVTTADNVVKIQSLDARGAAGLVDVTPNPSEKLKDPILSALGKRTPKVALSKKDRPLERAEEPLRLVDPKEGSIRSNNNEKVEVQYAVPIPLQLKVQERSPQSANKSEEGIQAIRRDILENHDREKREAVDATKESDAEAVIDHAGKNMQSASHRDALSGEAECAKQQRGTAQDARLFRRKSHRSVQPTAETLIKTNAYLSNQKFTDTISIESGMAGAGYVNIKKRDLKSANPDVNAAL